MSSSSDPSQTEGVSWGFILAECRRRIGEPKTWIGLDRVNQRIACWIQIRDRDPQEAEEVA